MKRSARTAGNMAAQLGVCAGLILIMAAIGVLWWQSRAATSSLSDPSSAAQQYYKRGLGLEEAGNNRGAEEAFLTAIALKPGYAPAHFALADLYDSADRPALAAEKLKVLLAADPHARHVQCRRAELYLKADGFEKVVKTARAELELDRKCPLGNSIMGMALLLAGDHKGAVEHLRTAKEAAPNDDAVTRTLAQILGQTGHAQEGLELVKPLLQGDKAPPEVEYMVGWLQMRSAPSDPNVQREAVQHLTRAVSIAPEYPAANGALGVLLVRMNMPAEALKFLERARKAGALDEEMADALAKAYSALHRPDAPKMTALAKATRDFNTKLKRLRAEWLIHSENVKNTVALAEMEARRGDPADARELVNGILKADPNQPDALHLLEEMVGKR